MYHEQVMTKLKALGIKFDSITQEEAESSPIMIFTVPKPVKSKARHAGRGPIENANPDGKRRVTKQRDKV